VTRQRSPRVKRLWFFPLGKALLPRPQECRAQVKLKSRTADNLEHIGGCRLLLQRFTQFVEQARILNRNDGLAGEAREQLDLLVGKRPDLLAEDGNRAD
jgi:hypothetical protein